MITPDEIREKAERLFPKAISAWLAAEDDFFPRRLAVDLSVKGKSHPQLIQAVSQLRERSKEVIGSGYTVLYERIHSRQFGDNLFPVAIHIDSLADLLKLTRRQTEFQRLERAVRCVHSNCHNWRAGCRNTPIGNSCCWLPTTSMTYLRSWFTSASIPDRIATCANCPCPSRRNSSSGTRPYYEPGWTASCRPNI